MKARRVIERRWEKGKQQETGGGEEMGAGEETTEEEQIRNRESVSSRLFLRTSCCSRLLHFRKGENDQVVVNKVERRGSGRVVILSNLTACCMTRECDM